MKTCGHLTSLKILSKFRVRVLEQMTASSEHISERSVDGKNDQLLNHHHLCVYAIVMLSVVTQLFISVFLIAKSSTMASNTKSASITARDK